MDSCSATIWSHTSICKVSDGRCPQKITSECHRKLLFLVWTDLLEITVCLCAGGCLCHCRTFLDVCILCCLPPCLMSLLALSWRRWTCGPWELPSTVSSLERQVCTFSISCISSYGLQKVTVKGLVFILSCVYVCACFLCFKRQPSSSIIHSNKSLSWYCCCCFFQLSLGIHVFFGTVGYLMYLLCVFHFLFPLPHLQCPFIDEYILALHNKIRTKPVEFPEM